MMETNSNLRSRISDKRRIVIKVGSSSLVHENTGEMDFVKLEQLVRLLCDLRNQDKDIILVSSGAIGVGRKALGLEKKTRYAAVKAGMRFGGTGGAYDDVSKAFW